jgi:hypothetical protein
MFKRAARPDREERLQQRQLRYAALLASTRPTVSAVCGGSTTGPIPKPVAQRNRALLDMAERRPCMLLVPGICNHRVDTTVACHSNLGIHGHAGARKADDQYSVWGCAACHRWLDTDRDAPAAQKEQAFMLGHARQVLAWRLVAIDLDEPERFRRAARWALQQLEGSAAP